MTAPARITQADIERAAKAARKAGWRGAHIKLNPDGTIDLFLTDAQPTRPGNEWDEELGNAA